jgi:hypothetical protein
MHPKNRRPDAPRGTSLVERWKTKARSIRETVKTLTTRTETRHRVEATYGLDREARIALMVEKLVQEQAKPEEAETNGKEAD